MAQRLPPATHLAQLGHEQHAVGPQRLDIRGRHDLKRLVDDLDAFVPIALISEALQQQLRANAQTHTSYEYTQQSVNGGVWTHASTCTARPAPCTASLEGQSPCSRRSQTVPTGTTVALESAWAESPTTSPTATMCCK